MFRGATISHSQFALFGYCPVRTSRGDAIIPEVLLNTNGASGPQASAAEIEVEK